MNTDGEFLALVRRIRNEKIGRQKRQAAIAGMILASCVLLISVAEIASGDFPVFTVVCVGTGTIAGVVHHVRMRLIRRKAYRDAKARDSG